jgi:hypothetical protein
MKEGDMSTRQSYLLRQKELFLVFILFYFVMMNCDRMPTGPKIPEESKLAVFCVLNPDQQTQTVLLQRTLTFDETVATSNPNLYISDAQIILEGPEGQKEAVPMLPGSKSSELQNVKYCGDFLWGSGNFNYLLDNQQLKSQEKYSLSVITEDYGSVQAEAMIPGPFQITEINIEPDLSSELYYKDSTLWWQTSNRPKDFRVTWTKSPGAAGYLVDIVVIQYDFSEWVRITDLSNDLGPGWLQQMVFPDSLDNVDVPYKEIPLTFETIHGQSLRGFLTHELKFEMSQEEMGRKIFQHLNFFAPADSIENKYMYQLRVTIHALSKSLFAFTMFQYLNLEEGRVVGQEVMIPDLGNVKGGVGVFGAVYTQAAFSRYNNGYIREYATIHDEYSPRDIYSPWRYNTDFLDKIPQNLQPDNNTVLMPGESLILSWDPVLEASLYLLVLKPHYLWFYPGNYVYLVRNNQVEIFDRYLPYRDCQIEWYVSAIKENPPIYPSYYLWLKFVARFYRGVVFSEDTMDVFAVGPGKGPLVLYGYYPHDASFYYMQQDSVGQIGPYWPPPYPHSYSLWSESRFINMPSGEMAGFEESRPVLNAPQEGAQLSTNGTLQWQEVVGADAYLVYIHSGEQTVIAASQETKISPPFPDECEWVDGLRGLEAFESGKTYIWQVCALRIKSGTLGFAVDLPQNSTPPRVYPRYQHPSGIMQTSQWSEEGRFVVQ